MLVQGREIQRCKMGEWCCATWPDIRIIAKSDVLMVMALECQQVEEICPGLEDDQAMMMRNADNTHWLQGHKRCDMTLMKGVQHGC